MNNINKEELKYALDKILTQAVQKKVIPGIVAAVANEEGIIYEGAVGKRGLTMSEDMSMDTVFGLRSMTKLPSSIAVMQLIEQGKLCLDDSVEDKLPFPNNRKIFEGFDKQGVPVFRVPENHITLRMLLNHTSGFAFPGYNQKMKEYSIAYQIPSITSGRFAAIDVPLMYEPGTVWEYGPGIEWVGQLIEKTSKQSLREYFREHIFLPLGMNNTEFVLNRDMMDNLAEWHVRNKNGDVTHLDHIQCQNPEIYAASSGLYATAKDYIILLQAMMNDGEYQGTRILKEETVNMMRMNQIGTKVISPLKSTDVMCTDMEFLPGIEKKWGLADMINMEELQNGRSAGSQFWCGGGNTYYWIDPMKKITGVFMTQIYPFVDYPVYSVFENFEATVYKAYAV